MIRQFASACRHAAAQIYRQWAVEERGASWVAKHGKISANPSAFPPWLLEINVWANTGWQCYDRFNDTQGDPPVAVDAASTAATRFGLGDDTVGGPMGLHYYEWNCGTLDGDECQDAESADRFRFDTMYPDYWPPRRGAAAFRAALAKLRAQGVRTFPYVNARIFDQLSRSYREAGGAAICARQPKRLGIFNASGGDLCTEFYGSYERDGREARGLARSSPCTPSHCVCVHTSH